MKKVILVLALAIVLGSCGGGSTTPSASDSTATCVDSCKVDTTLGTCEDTCLTK